MKWKGCTMISVSCRYQQIWLIFGDTEECVETLMLMSALCSFYCVFNSTKKVKCAVLSKEVPISIFFTIFYASTNKYWLLHISALPPQPLYRCIPTKHRSAITLIPLTSKGKINDHLHDSSQFLKHRNLSPFDNAKIIMARRLRQNISKTSGRSSEILWSPCFDGSDLFWLDKGDLDNIRLNSLMLWLFGVYRINVEMMHTVATSQFSASRFSVHKPYFTALRLFLSSNEQEGILMKEKKEMKIKGDGVNRCTSVYSCVWFFVWVTFASLTGLHVGPISEILCVTDLYNSIWCSVVKICCR